MKTVLTGITATGRLTLGNLIGAINNIKKFQASKDDVYLFVADFHALTLPIEKKKLEQNIKTNLAIYLASGIDPKKIKMFKQSEIFGHTELFFILSTLTYQGELQRMTQFKDKQNKLTKKEKMNGIPLGIYIYPVLMTADILLYNANYVPVGYDQSQHLELSRTLIERLNKKYNFNFNLPKTILNKNGAKIMALREPNKKMSKSDKNEKNTIFLLDNPKIIKMKISSALTDSEEKIYFDEEKKPGISNLLTIYATLENLSVKETEKKFKNFNYNDFKDEIANTIIRILKPLQEKFSKIGEKEIENALIYNREKIQKVAKKNLKTIMKGIGL